MLCRENNRARLAQTHEVSTEIIITLESNNHTLIKERKKWGPRRHTPNQPSLNAGKLRKRGKRGGIGGWREGSGRKELTASWEKISRAWAIGSTEAMTKVARERYRRSTSKTHNRCFCQSSRYSHHDRRLSKTPSTKLGAIRRRKRG